MPDFLGNVGNFFSSPAGKVLGEIAGIGATGAGLASNIAADRQRSEAAKLAEANANLTPAQLASRVSGATQPLDRALVQAITGNVTSNLAEQGLSEAPGLIATAESQALAPFQQQNQNAALQLVLRQLGLPQEFIASIPPNVNMSQLISLLTQGFGKGTSPNFDISKWLQTVQNNPSTTGPSSDYNFGNLIPPGTVPLPGGAGDSTTLDTAGSY